MIYKSTDVEVKVSDFDKEQLVKIENFIADMAEPSMLGEEYYIFENETLNVFFIKLIEVIDNMMEKRNFSDYVDEYGRLKVEVDVRK